MAGGTKREHAIVKQKIHIATICRIFPMHIVTHESIRFDMRSVHGRVSFFAFEPVQLFSNYSPAKRDNSVAFIPQTIGAFLMYNLSGLSDELATAYRAKPWHDKKPEKLLGVSNDAKTVKGEKIGVSTAILYLSPHNISGVNMCPMAEIAQCHEPCLNTAGRGAMTTVQLSRLRKTLYLNQYPEQFKEQLKREILAHILLSIKKNMIPAIRLNGTSDKRWELLIWDFMVEMYQKYGARFYDYTKIPNRIIPDRDVYDITFSYSGVADYARHYQTARAMGHRIAVVFRSKDIIPTTWDGLDVVSGDDSDVRFMDDHGVAVALYAKGKARHDTTGFVID